MKKLLFAVTVGAALSLSSVGNLSAQPWDAGLPGDDVFSLGLRLGAVSPSTTLPDGSKFSGGIGGALSATFWANQYAGLRANYEFGKTEGNDLELAPASHENPTVSFFGGELDLRYPVLTESLSLFPYVGAGAGGKMYDWSEDSTGIDRDLTFAWNLTGGVEVRPLSSPWIGVALEAKRYSSSYKWHASQWDPPTFSDLYFSLGVTLNR
jgi:opacity protein-like surface antigen